MKKNNFPNIPITVERKGLYEFVDHTIHPISGYIHASYRSNTEVFPENYRYDVYVNFPMQGMSRNNQPIFLGSETHKDKAEQKLYNMVYYLGKRLN